MHGTFNPMIALLAAATLLRADTAVDPAVVRAAVSRVLLDAQRGPGFAQVRVIDVDVASFRRVLGLSDDVPNDWRGVVDAAGRRGVLARADAIGHCDIPGDRASCKMLPGGVALVRANGITRRGDHVTLEVILSWFAGNGPHGRVYRVELVPAGDRYRVQRITLVMVGHGI